MSRVKRGVSSHRRRKLTLRLTKGFKWGRKTKYRLAKEAMIKAWKYSFRDRKTKKRAFRQLWEVQISAGLGQAPMPEGTKPVSYSRFIAFLKKKNIELDRKILSTFAKENPEIFQRILQEASAK